MTQTTARPIGTRDETEAWLVEALSETPLPLDDMMSALIHFGQSGFDRRVDGWAELVQDTLIEQQQREGLLQVLSLRAEWREGALDFKESCETAIKKVFTSRLEKTLVKNAGFDDAKVKSDEAVRRLTVLNSLKKGILCYEKTWGFGVVKRVDDFYGRVTIDFETKRAHEMAMNYAAEVLVILPPDHLLVRYHQEPEVIKDMVQSDAPALAKLTLSSYGALNVDQLKDHLTGVIFEAKDWKAFWDKARKGLKNDPLVYLPPKRSEPIQLLESAESHLDESFEALAALRTPEDILKKIDELENGGLIKEATDAHKVVMADRLAFAVWGAEGRDPVLMARALVKVEQLGLVPQWDQLSSAKLAPRDAYSKLLKPEKLGSVLSGLPVKMSTLLLDKLFTHFAEPMQLVLPGMIGTLPFSVLSDVVKGLEGIGAQETLQSSINELISQQKAGPALTCWLLKQDRESPYRAGRDETELLWMGLDEIEHGAAGDMLKAQHLIRALYETPEWLKAQMDPLSEEQREVFLAKVEQCAGWDESDRRAVIAIIVKAYPELVEQIANRKTQSAPKARRRMTSWRSYRERQAQFKNLMEKEIPDNAKEIAVARSYGDLRENAEYKYAKEHQRILYLRRDEMEQDLEVVQGTDFNGFDASVAGMGTVVEVERPGGAVKEYCILGEWDRDEALGIVSSLSQLAKQLEGHVAGDEVTLPGEQGDEACRLVSVKPLDERIKAWLNG